LTDGITETSNKKNEHFGMKKVKQIILNNRNDELSHIYEKINNELVSYGKQKDDQTILLIRCL
jgi:serine phosphatase RsbU (regulator of sigma subunit)